MKVTTQLARLRADRGNISYENISASTGIDSQQLRELEIGAAQAIAFTTLGKLCAFFQCTPNDLFALVHTAEIMHQPVCGSKPCSKSILNFEF